MKKLRVIALILLLVLLFASCRSVYIDPEESSEDLSEIIDGEYFTDGYLYKKGGHTCGYFYEGCWIYVEQQRTIGPRGTLVRDGKEYIRYDEVEMQRIVKYNPHTGVVSSPCLDPVCNHSFESGCVMLSPFGAGDRGSSFFIQALIGDWLLIFAQELDDEYITKNASIFYNLKTGETRKLFEEDLSGQTMTRWAGGSYVDHKYYNVKQTLDYSSTDYKQGDKGESVGNHTPQTKQIICEYDLDDGTSKELFEIPENYLLTNVSNKRFFFKDDTDVRYSCNHDGSNMKQEEIFDFSTSNKIGTYAYNFEGIDGFIMFDLTTNEKKSVLVDYDEYYYCVAAQDGILFDNVTKHTEYLERGKNRKEIIDEYLKTMSTEEAYYRFADEQNKILYSGVSQVYMTDFDGENMRLIYEEENAVIRSWYASGDYLFAKRSVLNDKNEVETANCVINMKTGEVTVPPLLEIVTPDWYVNDDSVFRD